MAHCGVKFPALSHRHAQPLAHQRVFPGRRQSAAECLLRHGRAARHRRPLRYRGHGHQRSKSGSSAGRGPHLQRISRSARCKMHRRRLRRLPGESRLAAAGLGSGGGKFPHPRHALRPRPRVEDLLDQGVAPVGDPTQCHAVAIDARAPKFDGGIVTRLDCVPFSIVVNRAGRALLRRGPGSLAQALRHLGPSGRPAARPDRL